jgi:hypothetical protein
VNEKVPSTEMIVVATLALVSTWKPMKAPTNTIPAQTAPPAHSANRTPPIERHAAMIAVTIVMLGKGQKLIPAAQHPRRNESKRRLRRSAARLSGERRAAA